jgi:hypothetical protein
MHPAARRDDVVVQELDPETMVYDSVRREFHLLNPLAALVFQHADGDTSPSDLAARAGEHLGADVGVPEVEAALAELERAHLLTSNGTARGARPSVTRREAAIRLAVLALGTPLVTSIIAPTPAMAASAAGRRGRGNDGVGDAGNDGPDGTPGNPGGSGTAPGHDDGNPGNDKDKEEKEKKEKEEKEKKAKEEKEKEKNDAGGSAKGGKK